MPELRIGTSGYQYDHWRGGLYPKGLPRREWLIHYASRFRSVELDTTFYGLPAAATVRRWREQVPDTFLFAAKMSRYGTHLKRLRDPGGWAARFLAALEPLDATLGPILVQLPPRWRRDPSRLADFFRAVPRNRRFAVEVRDRDWLHGSVYDILARHDAALCLHDLLPRHPGIATASWTYLRFHGPDLGRPYHGGYTTQALAGAARRIRSHLDAGRDVYAYFNNDVGGHAVEDAARLERYLASSLATPVLGRAGRPSRDQATEQTARGQLVSGRTEPS